MRGVVFLRVFQIRLTQPPGFKILENSIRVFEASNQWKACAAVMKSTLVAVRVVISAVPVMLLKPGYDERSSSAAFLISSLGSTQKTVFPFLRNNSDRIPVPEPMSATSDSLERPISCSMNLMRLRGYRGRYLA